MGFQWIFAVLCALLQMPAAWLEEDAPDALCLLQMPSATLERRQNASIHSVPLLKQYVPVKKDDKVVAYKTAYFGKVQVGTPAQEFTVVFDTGSGHLVLPQTSCKSGACAKHRRYDRLKSETAVDIDYNGSPMKHDAAERDQVVVSYGTGKVTGEFVHDLVCMSGDVDTCARLRMVLATEMTDDPFAMFEFDGVLGLGLDSLRLDPKFSFFGEMVAQNKQMLPQFSVFLSRHEDGKSMISFGGYDEARAASDIQWTPVAKPSLGYWLVEIKQVRIGDTVLDECTDGICHAVLDTGTSLLGVPRMAARSMHRLLARPAPTEGMTASDIDCRLVPGHSIDFDLGDFTVSLPVEDYSRPAPINVTTPDQKSSLMCRSLLLPVDMPPPVGPKVFILGEPMLRRYLTVYDLAEQRVGFSLARQMEPGEEQPINSIGAPVGSLLAGAPLPSAGTQAAAAATV
jgi:hypothetical protein